jgi:3-oxoacyl-(acyl-carrier-protein) synthase
MQEGRDIVIAGVGLITPLGRTVDEIWRQLLAGRFITDHGRAIERGNGDEPNVVELGDIAAREALADAGWDELHDDRTALVIGSSKGPADEWLVELFRTTDLPPVHAASESQKSWIHNVASTEHRSESRGTGQLHPPTSDNPSCESVTAGPAVMTMPGRPRIMGLHQIAEVLSERLAMAGPKLTVSAACASGLHALIRSVMMLQHGDVDRVLVIASESSLHEAFIQSFRRLGVIADPRELCRPMDVNRSGFLISEAAAAVCLERRQARPGEVAIDAYAMGADASHLTGTDPRALTLRSCLSRVVKGHSIDLVHAHATGTIANDPIELAAIETVCQGRSTTVYSHKGAIGHTLGASGMVATVLNVMAHRTGIVPGNISTRRPIATTAGRISRETLRHPISRSLVIAAGFGGATGVVGLRTA